MKNKLLFCTRTSNNCSRSLNLLPDNRKNLMDIIIVLCSSVVIPIVVLLAIVTLKKRELQKQSEKYKHFQTLIQEKERVQSTMEQIIQTKDSTIHTLKSFIHEDTN